MFEFLKKKPESEKQDPRHNHSFDDDDRAFAVDIRRINKEIKRTQFEMELMRLKAERDELKAELQGDDIPDNENDLALSLLPLLIANKGGNTPQQDGNSKQSPPVSISDDEIRQFLKSQDKKKLNAAKALPKTMLFRMTTQQLPMTENEFERAYKILQEEF